MLVVWDKEIRADLVAVRKRNGHDLGTPKLEEFIQVVKKEIKEKKLG